MEEGFGAKNLGLNIKRRQNVLALKCIGAKTVQSQQKACGTPLPSLYLQFPLSTSLLAPPLFHSILSSLPNLQFWYKTSSCAKGFQCLIHFHFHILLRTFIPNETTALILRAQNLHDLPILFHFLPPGRKLEV